MARESRSVSRKKSVQHNPPLTKRNYQILGWALLCIVLGYVALAQKPWDGTLPLVVAPSLLFLGYCVLVPLGILYRNKREETRVEALDGAPGSGESGYSRPLSS